MNQCVILFLLLFGFNVAAQSNLDMDEMLHQEKYTEVLPILNELFEKEKENPFVYTQLMYCALHLPDQRLAQATFDTFSLAVDYQHAFVKLDNQILRIVFEKQKIFLKDKTFLNNIQLVLDFANRLQNLGLYDLAMEVLDNSRQETGQQVQYIDAYIQLGKKSENYQIFFPALIENLKLNPNKKSEIETEILHALNEKNEEWLEKYLSKNIKKDINDMFYSKFLMWLYVQKNQWQKAILKATELDKGTNREGLNLLILADMADKINDRNKAIQIYSSVLKNFPQSEFNDEVILEYLHLRSLENNYQFSKPELDSFASIYTRIFSNTSFVKYKTFYYSDFLAFGINRVDSAIKWLESKLITNIFSKHREGEIKLKLGDYFCMDDNRWDATLYYAQIEKDFEEDVLGEEARYRNSRLSYFYGDYQWAKDQVEILRTATSELIANDALKLYLTIVYNTPPDSNYYKLNLFSKAEWYDWKFESTEAINLLNHLLDTLPKQDEMVPMVYLKLGKIYSDHKNWDKAESVLLQILENAPDCLEADDALFMLIKLAKAKGQKEILKNRIELFFKKYNDSTLITEIRLIHQVM